MEMLKILVCDDEAGMRAGVTRALRNFTVDVPEYADTISFETAEAESGEDALAQIGEHPPHILLLDHKLPGISGLDVLDALAENPQEDMLTVMITAYASIETAVRATKQGAYDFLPKPFTPDELKTTVRKAAKHLMVARQARKLVEEKRRVRFEFISVVAHELKSPINAIEGYLNILNDGTTHLTPEVSGQVIGRCVTRISGMRKMINDLLDLTRIESGQKPRELGTVDVADVARIAIESVTPDALARDITVRLEADPDVHLFGDHGEIEIIFNNLVSNAIKYNKDGGSVEVVVRKTDAGTVISVTDTGIGMAPEEASRLFNDFVRIKNEKTRNILGSGLGLSILKKLVSLYNGDIKVKSKPEEGSTFTVTLHDTTAETETA